MKNLFSKVDKKLASLLHLRHSYWNTGYCDEFP